MRSGTHRLHNIHSHLLRSRSSPSPYWYKHLSYCHLTQWRHRSDVEMHPKSDNVVFGMALYSPYPNIKPKLDRHCQVLFEFSLSPLATEKSTPVRLDQKEKRDANRICGYCE